MKISKTATIGASQADIWKVIALEYDRVDRWASAVSRSESAGKGSKLNGAPFNGRTCETSLGPFKESIVVYDENRGELGYEAQSAKMPFFVKGMRADWKLTPQSGGKTHVQMQLTVRLLPVFNVLMALPMRLQLSKVVGESLEECKHFVETGHPHPRKQKLVLKTARA